jgi:hypothetical protein
LRSLALHQHFPRGQIQLDLGAADHGMRAAVTAADHRAHPGQQLAELVGLDQVVVGADVQAGHAVVQAIAGREDQHRRLVAPAAGLAQHLRAIQLGQAQVQQHAGVVAVVQRALRQQAVLDPVHRPAVRVQGVAQALSDHLVVFDQQHAHGFSRSLDPAWMMRRVN